MSYEVRSIIIGLAFLFGLQWFFVIAMNGFSLEFTAAQPDPCWNLGSSFDDYFHCKGEQSVDPELERLLEEELANSKD